MIESKKFFLWLDFYKKGAKKGPLHEISRKIAHAIAKYDCMQPALSKGYLMPKKQFLKGVLKGEAGRGLIKWLGP